jgi:trimethylamine:corrinoid methyltransferase-like protein
MKRAMILLLLMVGAQMAAQDRSTVTVKGSEVISGVVIVNVVQPNTPQAGKSSFQLNCNKGASACKAPEPGTYLMVRLPKNWGMYDCDNVDLYPASADPASAQRIGEYCLMQK